MANIGYVRVSTTDQNTERQLDGIHLDKTFTDKVSGATTDRPALQECLEYLREGDVLHIHSMDRLARNLMDLQTMVESLTSRGVVVEFHKEHLTFTNDTSPISRLMLQIMGAVAEFERSLIRERQQEGIDKAKQEGRHLGRRWSMSLEDIQAARAMIEAGSPKAKVAAHFGVSRQSLYRNLERKARQGG